MSRRAVLPGLLILALAACASPAIAPPPAFDAAAAVAAIRAAGAAAAHELVIQPLADPQIADLRESALRLQAQGDYPAAALALDRALAINPEDPSLLQERAELAVLQHEPARAEQLARRALATGSAVGPLCRRHWETIAQVHLRAPATATQAATVSAAREARDACTVAAPERF